MVCPKCRHDDTRVLDSRDSRVGKEIRRRRKCAKCGYRFTTFERVETTSFIVIKKDNSRESYNREKLERGIWKACEKRPVTKEQVDGILNELEEEWAKIGKEIPTKVIGEGIMDKMRKLDEVAYIRFASVYRKFEDVSEFLKEVQEISAV